MNKFLRILSLASLALGLIASAHAATETYAIDPVHSSVGFSIRHVFSKVPGSFTKFSGNITLDRADLEQSSVETTIEIGSLDTRSAKRDSDVQGAEYFNTAKHPAITFKSTAWKKTGADTYDVTGNLTIKGVTKSVVLQVKQLGFGPGLMGAYVSGWDVTTTLNRHDFGVDGPGWLGKAIGDEVAVTISIEADLKK
ncbi:MAG: Polyisoprenoid-binding protein YceI [Verrucomicrobia bacterium]|jgi:polyisoprenoid-binding protein YceI|nr:MAG: Polyisoprenoid-binding protein YceI [Verrucomicrobiota bacterium]